LRYDFFWSPLSAADERLRPHQAMSRAVRPRHRLGGRGSSYREGAPRPAREGFAPRRRRPEAAARLREAGERRGRLDRRRPPRRDERRRGRHRRRGAHGARPRDARAHLPVVQDERSPRRVRPRGRAGPTHDRSAHPLRRHQPALVLTAIAEEEEDDVLPPSAVAIDDQSLYGDAPRRRSSKDKIAVVKAPGTQIQPRTGSSSKHPAVRKTSKPSLDAVKPKSAAKSIRPPPPAAEPPAKPVFPGSAGRIAAVAPVAVPRCPRSFARPSRDPLRCRAPTSTRRRLVPLPCLRRDRPSRRCRWRGSRCRATRRRGQPRTRARASTRSADR